MSKLELAKADKMKTSRVQASPWTLLSWLSPLLALGFVAFLFTSSIGQGQTATFSKRGVKSFLNPTHATTVSDPSTQHLYCTISSFFSIDANEQVADNVRIEGRGLASCRSDQGVATEMPIYAVIDAKAIGNWANAGELSFNANSSTFVIPREVAQIQDTYLVKSLGAEVADRNSPSILLEGSRGGVVIEFRLTSSTDALQKIEISSMTLHFDEDAPTLE